MCFIQLTLVYIFPEELINWSNTDRENSGKLSDVLSFEYLTVALLLLKNASLEHEKRAVTNRN